MKNKLSSIVRETRVINSNSFNELTPVMKQAIQDVFSILEKNQKLTLENFEGAIEKVGASRNINKEDLYNYFNKEVNEQLGVK
jgi:hypothetical protein